MAPTAQTLKYTPLVNVDLSNNEINFADALLEGHRIAINVPVATLNTHFKWSREAGSDRPVGNCEDLSGLKAALETAFATTYYDQDGIVGAQDLSTASIANVENQTQTMNDVIMAQVLFKVYGASNQDTNGKVFNTADALNMVSNAAVAEAITTSIDVSGNGRGKPIDLMFRDLLAADPTRYFDGSGIQVAGLFETYTDASGSGDWALIIGDIIQVNVTFTFAAQVSRRVVSAQEQPTTAGNTAGSRSEEVTEEVILAPGHKLPVRFLLTASA